MLKSLDFLVGLKILAANTMLTQMHLATQLCLSSSQVNAALKKLIQSGLFVYLEDYPFPVFQALEEFLICGARYCYPAKLGTLTVGMPTAYGAKPISDEIMVGSEPVPVWPFAYGSTKGMALEPLHKNVPKALAEYPDPLLHDFLVLLDTLRVGRAREKALAKKYLNLRLKTAQERISNLHEQ